jgi:hypothetical protein
METSALAMDTSAVVMETSALAMETSALAMETSALAMETSAVAMGSPGVFEADGSSAASTDDEELSAVGVERDERLDFHLGKEINAFLF